MFKEEKKAGIRVVICNDLGQVMVSVFKNISLPSSVENIEALVAVRALIFAQEVGFSSIILEGDSDTIINSLRS